MAYWKLPIWILLVSLIPALLNGQEEDAVLSPDRSIAEVVDFYLDRNLEELALSSARQATDSALLRRTTLDLVGRIPTVSEAQSYVSDTASDKRLKMVDRLLASPGYRQHQVHELGQLLHPDDSKKLQAYLTQAVNQNTSWDRIFRDLMLPPVKSEQAPEADHFIKSRIGDIDKLANVFQSHLCQR